MDVLHSLHTKYDDYLTIPGLDLNHPPSQLRLPKTNILMHKFIMTCGKPQYIGYYWVAYSLHHPTRLFNATKLA